MTRSGRPPRAAEIASSTERALTIEKSIPPKTMAKAFWIVTLSSAIKIRFAIRVLGKVSSISRGGRGVNQSAVVIAELFGTGDHAHTGPAVATFPANDHVPEAT